MSDTAIRSPFDIRSNLFALISINLAVLSSDTPRLLPVIFALIIALLLLAHARRAAVVVAGYAGVLAILCVLVDYLPHSSLQTALYAGLRLSAPFICASCMGYYFIKVTPANLLLAGLTKLHCPRALTTSLAVIFRLLPTLGDNARAIVEAMRIRGLTVGYFLLHPLQVLEYFVIPFISATIRSGEALTATAITRGLGSPQTPTSICRLTFRWQDGILFLICIVLAIIAWIPS